MNSEWSSIFKKWKVDHSETSRNLKKETKVKASDSSGITTVRVPWDNSCTVIKSSETDTSRVPIHTHNQSEFIIWNIK